MPVPDIVVFAGPSLTRDDRHRQAGIRFLPPIAQGDLFCMRHHLPRKIGIVDGYFGDRLSIFHKEILWAMGRGARVFGAASMGALRAAELDVHGMIGIGEIYARYRDGHLVADDAVAVLHGPEELDFMPTTVAMVDISATVRRLKADGALSPAHARRLDDAGESLHFSRRTWQAIAVRAFGDCAQARRIAGVLKDGHVDKKRQDARLLCDAILSETPEVTTGPVPTLPPSTPAYRASARRAPARPDSNDP